MGGRGAESAPRLFERGWMLRRITSSREAVILGITLALIGIFYLTSQGKFLNPGVIHTMLTAAPELGIIVIGVTLLMIAGEFDLSVGSSSALCALAAIKLYQLGLNPFLALLIVLAISLGMGALNGLITVKFGLPSFIVTLGSMMAWRGVVYVVTMGRVINFDVGKTCPSFYRFLVGDVGVVPLHFFWFLGLALIAFLVLGLHRFGNHIYATGGNREAARAMGINTDRVKIACFMLVSALAALAGIMRATRIRGFYAQQGVGMELMAIASAVIGGTSLFGGVGTVVGSFLGTLVVTFLEYGLIMSKVSGYWYKVILGCLIISVVIGNKLWSRRGT